MYTSYKYYFRSFLGEDIALIPGEATSTLKSRFHPFESKQPHSSSKGEIWAGSDNEYICYPRGAGISSNFPLLFTQTVSCHQHDKFVY